MARSVKLSAPMRAAATALERCGALYRHHGGYWSAKKPGDATFDPRTDRYYKSVTIEALAERGLADIVYRNARQPYAATQPGFALREGRG